MANDPQLQNLRDSHGACVSGSRLESCSTPGADLPHWIYSEHVLLPGEGRVHVAPASVGIEGTRIVAVQPGQHAEAEVLRNRLLAPAFVNAHTHLAMSAYRGIGGMASLRNNVVEDLYFVLESGLQPGDVLIDRS